MNSDDIQLISEKNLKLSAVSNNYDLLFTAKTPGTHEITIVLNAIYEGSSYSTERTLIVEAG